MSYRLEQRTAAEVFSALDKVLTFPVPAAVVEEERRAMAQQYAQAMRSRGLEAPKDIPDSMFQEPAVKKARILEKFYNQTEQLFPLQQKEGIV